MNQRYNPPRKALCERLAAACGLSVNRCYVLLRHGERPSNPVVAGMWDQIVVQHPDTHAVPRNTVYRAIAAAMAAAGTTVSIACVRAHMQAGTVPSKCSAARWAAAITAAGAGDQHAS